MVDKMKSIQYREWNALPVTTFRWLKLNHLQLEAPLTDPSAAYHKEYLVDGMSCMDKDVLLRKMTDPAMLPEHIEALVTKDTTYGVGADLIRECEDAFNTGILLYVPEDKKIDSPIRVEYVLDHKNSRVVDYNIIYAAPNSRTTVIIDYSTDDAEVTHNGAMKIYAREGSEITIIKIQRMNDLSHHFDSNIAHIDENAKVNYIQVELGSKASVTNYKNVLNEAGEANLMSIYFGDGDRLIDLNYLMQHKGRQSKSSIQTKGALKDYAIKNFRGTIDFQRGASKSEGSEEEYVLLFDKKVKSNAIPLLLCSEDDVKGQHAASAGKVDSEKLFYMMSRGFNKEEAMKMIVEASFQPIIERIPIQELRNIISEEIKQRLG